MSPNGYPVGIPYGNINPFLNIPMASPAPVVAPAKKVYYVLTRESFGEKRYRSHASDEFSPWGAKSVADAFKFSSVVTAAAALAISHNAGSTGMSIIRVEETPAPAPVVKLVSTTVIDATKPVAIFSAKRKAYAKKSTTGFVASASSLQESTILNDVNDALTFIQDSVIATVKQYGGLQNTTVATDLQLHQVSLVTGTPTITETVLS